MTATFLAKLGPEELEQEIMNQAVAFFNAGSRCIADVSITPAIKEYANGTSDRVLRLFGRAVSEIVALDRCG